jgi:small GTP-binding protein
LSKGTSRRYFKVCLIGDGYVGKTSVRRKYLGKVFKANYIATLGVDFAQKALWYDDTPTSLVIWDIAGQPVFQSLRKRYYEGCSGIILVYSVIDRASFDSASKWLVEAHGFMGRLPPLIIAGNKIDLRPSHSKEEVVSFEEGAEFAEKIGQKMNTPAIFIETSALTGENIDEAFDALTEMMFTGGKPAVSKTIAPQTPTPVPEVATVVSETSIPVKTEPTPAVVETKPPEAVDTDGASVPEVQVEREPIELLNLRSELKKAESELSDVESKLDLALLNLKNVVHVKRMMYEHLQKQLRETRQEWAEAYDEYKKTDERKKTETAERIRKIEEIKKRIELAGKDTSSYSDS